MVNISELSQGMRVKIVDEWMESNGKGRQDTEGEMSVYLGSIVTVGGIYNHMRFENHFMSIKEDKGTWNWYPEMLDYIIYDDEEDFEPASDEELELMLFGR